MTRDSALRLFALATLPLGVGFATARAQTPSELRGRVVSDSGVPVRSATITIAGIGYSVRADSLGQFRLAGTPGSTLNLTIAAAGFRDDSAVVVLARGRTLVRDFTLVSESTALPEANPSDRVLRGRVTDVEGGPLAYANIQVNGGRRFLSDDSGRFNIPISVSGRFSLLIRRIGFAPEDATFDAMPDTAVRFRMQAVATSLPEQRVIGRSAFVSLDLGGFYRRLKDAERGINHGYFITPEELEFRKPVMLTAAVEQLPTVRIRPPPGGVPLNRNLRIEDRNGCPFTVYLDRIRIAGRNEYDVNQLLVPAHVAGIELYPRAIGAPPEYQANNGTCGIVLIWTK